MSIRKSLPYFVGSILILAALACGATPPQPTPTSASAPTSVSTSVPTSAPLPATAGPSGHITGHAYLQGPPTPALVVYAVDSATGNWAFTEVGPADGEAPFDLVVPPGSYQVFGAVAKGTAVGIGYSPDGMTLARIDIAAGQTITGINVTPPGAGQCGPMIGYPASPDGKYAVTAGPSAACLASIKTPSAPAGSYAPVTPEICGTIKELASQAIALDFSMEADTPFQDPQTGESGRGCTLTAMATGMKFSDPNSVLQTLVQAMQGWEEKTSYQAGGPTGVSTAMTRDMALMFISVGWMPSPDANCPKDQPISACDLKPEQKLYTVQIETAMK